MTYLVKSGNTTVTDITSNQVYIVLTKRNYAPTLTYNGTSQTAVASYSNTESSGYFYINTYYLENVSSSDSLVQNTSYGVYLYLQ